MNKFLKGRLPSSQFSNGKTIYLVLAGIVSAGVYIFFRMFSSGTSLPYEDTMLEASRMMERAIEVIRDHHERSGMKIDESADPNRTGLIGPEFSELTTTLGHLEAKRTTTNPNMAGLIVHLLSQGGVMPGDTIAVGCSASFPALIVSVLSACQAMDVYPVVIISLGASSHGATDVHFNLLDIYQLLLKEGIVKVGPAEVTLGGEKDVGQDYAPAIRERLLRQIRTSGVPLLREPDLRKNVAMRMTIYQGHSGRRRVSAFINTGGSYANLGTNSLALNIKPGLNKKLKLPPVEERGVIFEMASQGIPVVHLLYIRGLALKFGLSWDPVPLPQPGEGEFYRMQHRHRKRLWTITFVYFILLTVLYIKYRRNRKIKN
jgi:poly-gamma-glutamate system protein